MLEWWEKHFGHNEAGEVKAWARKYGFCAPVGRRKGSKKWLQILLKYNGDWGALNLGSVVEGTETSWLNWLPVLRASTKVQTLWKKLQHEIEELGVLIKSEDMAISLWRSAYELLNRVEVFDSMCMCSAGAVDHCSSM